MIFLKRNGKFGGMFLAMLWVLLLLGSTGKVHAWNLELTTTVPLNIELEIIIHGEGSVRLGSFDIVSSSIVEIDRNTKTKVILIPDSNYEINSVILNDEDFCANVHESSFVLPELSKRSVLEIFFVKKEIAPNTGEDSMDIVFPALFIAAAQIVLVSQIVCICRRQSTQK